MSQRDDLYRDFAKRDMAARHERARFAESVTRYRDFSDNAKALAALNGIEVGTGVRREVSEPQSEETADQQLAGTRARLCVLFEGSRCFPAELTCAWIEALDRLDVWQPEMSLRLFDQLESALTDAKQRYRPTRDILSLSPSNERYLERHCSEIGACYHCLRQLMEHAQSFLAEHPNGI